MEERTWVSHAHTWLAEQTLNNPNNPNNPYNPNNPVIGRDDWWNTHYSWSRNGVSDWSKGDTVTADPNITLSTGGVYQFTNRERPQLFFNHTTGEPVMLFNGVCPGEKYTYAYTLAQRLNTE